MSLPTNPQSRSEEYLNAIATGSTSNLPEPESRMDAYLDYIARNGGGGGGSSLPEVTSSDKDKYLHTNSSTGDLEWSAVSGGGGGALRVAITTEDMGQTYETDKTWQEIYDAVTTGAGAFGVIDMGQTVALGYFADIYSNHGYGANIVGFTVLNGGTATPFGMVFTAPTANSTLQAGDK